MLQSELFSGIVEIDSTTDCNITDVCCDTRKLDASAVFVCIKGDKTDGHNLCKDVKAAYIICERDISLENQIIVENTREVYAKLCKRFYGDCADSLTLVAATGTNGKTSTMTVTHRILEKAGRRAGLISTINASFCGKNIKTERTTPDAHTLHKLFFDMKKGGCELVCMEASSHALAQSRLYGCKFKVSAFLNLTRDHLDYHADMEEYYKAKRVLFDMSDCAVINLDDEYGRRLLSEISIPAVTFSVENKNADFYADEISDTVSGVSFILHHDGVQCPVSFSIPGRYSVQNALCAIAICKRLGLSLETILNAIDSCGTISGRSELLTTDEPFRVICDYAHTPDGLLNILKSAREYTKGRIILVFGCGGDRDRQKRPIMGGLAASYADYTVVTSDNPRTEPPNAIISDIIRGMPPKTAYIAIPCRTRAISYAIRMAKADDTVLLCGKGHETYQVLGDKQLYYDERRVVKGCLNAMRIEESLKNL